MPNLQTLPFDIFIFGLRIAFIGIIYLFIFQVMRVLVRDLRQVAYTAWIRRGENPGPADNIPLIREVVALKLRLSSMST